MMLDFCFVRCAPEERITINIMVNHKWVIHMFPALFCQKKVLDNDIRNTYEYVGSQNVQNTQKTKHCWPLWKQPREPGQLHQTNYFAQVLFMEQSAFRNLDK